jgi:hypothetical protein
MCYSMPFTNFRYLNVDNVFLSFKKTLTHTNLSKFSFTASVVRIEAATKFGDVYNMDNTFFEFQENINFLYDL